jgi:hypothetical protein
VQDLTENGEGVSESIKCGTSEACDNSSAEVISEAPGGGPPAYGLSDFGGENYTNSEVETESGVVGGLSKVKGASNSDYIDMYSGSTGDELAYASALEGGAAFIDIWNAST